jgi:hypothetical protein
MVAVLPYLVHDGRARDERDDLPGVRRDEGPPGTPVDDRERCQQHRRQAQRGQGAG